MQTFILNLKCEIRLFGRSFYTTKLIALDNQIFTAPKLQKLLALIIRWQRGLPQAPFAFKLPVESSLAIDLLIPEFHLVQ